MMDLDIVMPYYGDVAMMKQAVASVLNQTVQGWHLTVLDDCYPDSGPQEFFESIDDDRVTYIRHPENLGAAANYEFAWKLVTGTHVVFMGADDVMLPHYVEAMAAAVAAFPDAAVFHPGVQVIDESGRPVRPLADRVKTMLRPRFSERYLLPPRQKACTTLLHGDWAYFPSMMWNARHAAQRTSPTQFQVVHDLALLIDVLVRGGDMLLLNDMCFQYRRHGKSMSSTTAWDGRRFDEERAFFSEVGPRLSALGWTRAARAARIHATSRLNAALVGTQLLVHGRPGLGLQLLGSHALAGTGARRRSH